MMGALQNQMRMQALMASQLLSPPRVGLVTSYDPDNFAVKVSLQPSGTETGWMPIVTSLSGNGFGIYAGPSQDDQAVVVFQEGSVEVGFCIGFLPSTVDQPPNVPAGEILVQHTSGALLHFLADGSVQLTAPAGLKIAANTAITGNLTVSGDVTDHAPGNTASMKVHRDAYDTHVHPGVQSGAASTLVTTSTV